MKYLRNVASLRLIPEKCTGCGICREVCPHGVLVADGRKVSISDPDLCMECSACARNCPFGAITVDQGVGCASALIRSLITGSEPTCGCSDQSKGGTCC